MPIPTTTNVQENPRQCSRRRYGVTLVAAVAGLFVLSVLAASATAASARAASRSQVVIYSLATGEQFYTLGANVIYANGAFNFNAPSFTLTLAGGSGRYDDVDGVLVTSPAANRMQRVAFRMKTG